MYRWVSVPALSSSRTASTVTRRGNSNNNSTWSTSQQLGYDVLARLEDDASHIEWTPPSGGDPAIEYLLFARNGFARSVREAAADRDDLTLFDLEDVVGALHE